MNNDSFWGRWAGWGVAIVLVVALGVLGWMLHKNIRENAALRQRLKQAEVQVSDLEKKLKDLVSANEQKKSEEEARAALPVLPFGNAENGSLFGRVMKAMLAETMNKDKEKKKDWVADLVSGFSGLITSEQGKEFMSVATGFVADQILEKFFEEAKLDPDVEDQVRDIVSRNMKDDVDTVMDLFKGDFNMAKAMEAFKTLRADPSETRIREELAGVLTEDQMAQWDKRNAAMENEDPKRIIEGSLMMSVPDLAPETRTLIAEAIIDESKASRESRPEFNFTDMFDMHKVMENAITEQQAVRDRVQERLAQELDEEHMKVVERYFHQQEHAQEMGTRLVEIFFQAAAPAATPAAAP